MQGQMSEECFVCSKLNLTLDLVRGAGGNRGPGTQVLQGAGSLWEAKNRRV